MTVLSKLIEFSIFLLLVSPVHAERAVMERTTMTWTTTQTSDNVSKFNISTGGGVKFQTVLGLDLGAITYSGGLTYLIGGPAQLGVVIKNKGTGATSLELTESGVKISSDTSFATATATATFAGWVDIGWERISNDCGSVASCTATCTTGKKILGGGCDEGTINVYSEGYPSSNSTFFCSHSNTQQLTAYAICARIR